jgi:hypothetical protein
MEPTSKLNFVTKLFEKLYHYFFFFTFSVFHSIVELSLIFTFELSHVDGAVQFNFREYVEFFIHLKKLKLKAIFSSQINIAFTLDGQKNI